MTAMTPEWFIMSTVRFLMIPKIPLINGINTKIQTEACTVVTAVTTELATTATKKKEIVMKKRKIWQ